MVKMGGHPPSLFSGAKEKLASLWHGWRDVLGTDKALTVLNPPAQLLVTAKVPRVTSLMSFGGAAASVSHGGCSQGDKATFEDSFQQGAQAGSSTRRVQGIFGLPGHAEGDGGFFSPRLGEMVTADVGTCLLLASQLFKHTAVTWRRGDRDSDPSCCSPKAQGTCPASFAPHQTLEDCNTLVGSTSTGRGCVRQYHPAPMWSPHCIQDGTKLLGTASPGPQTPPSASAFTYPGSGSRPLCGVPGSRGTP